MMGASLSLAHAETTASCVSTIVICGLLSLLFISNVVDNAIGIVYFFISQILHLR